MFVQTFKFQQASTQTDYAVISHWVEIDVKILLGRNLENLKNF